MIHDHEVGLVGFITLSENPYFEAQRQLTRVLLKLKNPVGPVKLGCLNTIWDIEQLFAW